ncbi:MAG: hypothetical protein BGO31_02260 [Bacteroidetes bacterium 43-16]|nr:MAG: hypothetical protein BGO31_02260 [Bacteroidetes bacterium 43-16]
MKNKFFPIIAALSFMSAAAQAQWQLQHPSPTAGIGHLQVFGTDTLFASTQSSEAFVLRSYNGGSTIDSITFPNMSMIRQHFINGTTGFVTGYIPFSSGSSLFKTTNGGNTWQTINLSIDINTQHLNIHFIDTAKGFISKDNTLYQTSDGGATFIARELISEPHYISNIHFINPQTGFVSLVRTQTDGELYRDMIFKTADAGASWQQVYSRQTPGQVVFVYPGISNMQFINNQTGFAVASGVPSTLLKTENGGQSWDTLPFSFANEFESMADVHFITEQTGYTAVGQHIYKTVNGGQSWEQQTINPAGDYFISDLTLVNENLGYASGSGLFKTTNGGGTVSVSTPKVNALGISIYPNPASGTLNILKPADLTLEQVNIIDASGRVMLNATGSLEKINTQSFSKGNYWLNISTQKGRVSIPFLVQ